MTGKVAEDASTDDSILNIALTVLDKLGYAVGDVPLKLDFLAHNKSFPSDNAVGMVMTSTELLTILRAYVHVRHLSSLGSLLQERLLDKTGPGMIDPKELYGSIFTAVKLAHAECSFLGEIVVSKAAKALECSDTIRLEVPIATLSQWKANVSEFNGRCTEALLSQAISLIRQDVNRCTTQEVIGQWSICFVDNNTKFDDMSAMIMSKDTLDTVIGCHTRLRDSRENLARVCKALNIQECTSYPQLDTLEKVVSKTIRQCIVAAAFVQGSTLLAEYRNSAEGACSRGAGRPQ